VTALVSSLEAAAAAISRADVPTCAAYIVDVQDRLEAVGREPLDLRVATLTVLVYRVGFRIRHGFHPDEVRDAIYDAIEAAWKVEEAA
jgi:hypothetical protein